MIIISQDRKTIYNFNNVKSIDVLDNEIYITDDILADKGTLIGRYKTEERAKEVLQEIIERYTNWNNLVYGQPTGECSPKYEMPKE